MEARLLFTAQLCLLHCLDESGHAERVEMLSAVPLYARQGKMWPSRLFGRPCNCSVCLELPLSPALLALGQDGHSIVFADIKLRVSGLQMLSETVFLVSF